MASQETYFLNVLCFSSIIFIYFSFCLCSFEMGWGMRVKVTNPLFSLEAPRLPQLKFTLLQQIDLPVS